jgi:hypothetical protein
MDDILELQELETDQRPHTGSLSTLSVYVDGGKHCID